MPFKPICRNVAEVKADAIVNVVSAADFLKTDTVSEIFASAGEQFKRSFEGNRLGACDTVFCAPCSGFSTKQVICIAEDFTSMDVSECRKILRESYLKAFGLAQKMNLQSIAVPLICGKDIGLENDSLVKIIVDAAREFLFENELQIFLVVSDKGSYNLYGSAFFDVDKYISLVYEERCEESICFNTMPSEALFDFAPPDFEEKILPAAKESAERTTAKFSHFKKLDDGFAVKLLRLIDQKGVNEVQCYKKANVSKQTWYKIMNNENYKPNKKTVISFAVALELSLEETQELLEAVGFILSKSSLFDVIIMYCLENGIYNIIEIDSLLFQYDQELLCS